MNAMKKAHEIRRAAAAKFNCKVSEIHFGECLRMAHNGYRIEQEIETVLSPIEKLEVLGNKIVEAVELSEFGMTLNTGLTSWEFGFIADNWNRFQRYGADCRISPKHAVIIERCYEKAA